MARPAYDPFKDESLGQRPKRRPAIRIDWKTIATRMAEGAAAQVVAADLGLAEERIWRHLRRSLRFRHYLTQAIERRRLTAQLQINALGGAAAVSRLLQPDSMDGATLQALLGRADSAAGEAGDVVKLLGETGGAPPNMALRARIRAERARMDAVVAQCKADVAARYPDMWAETADSGKGAADSSGPQRTLADSSGP
ncbi:MAG TPA: hypothetical protein VKZ87_09500 [Ferrovibrio sp.]|jgi:hypothetical protein|uniref:hypothetical protein n=1 Tax=Ferrovibrio sp. TaxID=1917215 RepID=UPI002B4B1EB4|nr:hypothetical protein [Ferrovibrio sp.]HLT77610.1 hypothetical protein [Ferrovibrio sp.]